MSPKKKNSLGFLYLIAIYIIGIGTFAASIFQNGWNQAVQNMPPQLLVILILAPLIIGGIKWFFRGKGEFKIYTNKDASSYVTMRNKAISITPEQLGVNSAQLGDLPYGVIMDFADTENAYFTLVAWGNGETSVYGNKGGVIGMGNSILPNAAARHFVATATQCRNIFFPAQDLKIPPFGSLAVVLKTARGDLKVSSTIEDAIKPGNPLNAIILSFRELIGAIEATAKPFKLFPGVKP